MKHLRKLLFPFSIIYYIVTLARNYFFDRGWLKSKSYDFPVIGIGNLSTGGTGKSPMTEYILRLLKDRYLMATLSRGYGRKTTGFRAVDSKDNADQVGDEPLQFAKKFPDVQIAVNEDRQEGITLLQKKASKPDIIVLDDVFQHRKVTPGFLILLTTYESPFYNDFLLPAGNLRESRKGVNR
ncbi:MAG: tetraacyldisaccharide 4'-kinase, partial [Leeuwenhoekiella sp.]